MSLYEEVAEEILEIDEKSDVGMTYMARVASEIRRAALEEKAARKITQQAIADKVGTSRAVINREMSGLENLTARRTAEILWALGWEPYFEARKIRNEAGRNDAPTSEPEGPPAFDVGFDSTAVESKPRQPDFQGFAVTAE
jgi:hypothetical protein